MRLPGTRRQRQLRGWTTSELAKQAGLDYKSAMKADLGRSVSEATARRLAATFAEHPVPEGMAELLEVGA